VYGCCWWWWLLLLLLEISFTNYSYCGCCSGVSVYGCCWWFNKIVIKMLKKYQKLEDGIKKRRYR
jgi:hypothetical protein